MIADNVDILDLDTFLEGHPFQYYETLLSKPTLTRHAGSGDWAPFWLASRYRDLQQISRDTTNFSSEAGFNLGTARKNNPGAAITDVIGRNILGFDNPDHAAFQRIILPAFTSDKVRALATATDAFVTEVLDALEGKSEVDFVSEVASRIPIRVLCLLLGIPLEDEAKILSWTNRMVGAEDPEFSPDPTVTMNAYLETFEYGRWLLEERRKKPGDDVMTLLAHAEIDGTPISDATRDGMCATLIAAGNETTRNGISGAVHLFTRYPSQKEKLLRNPDLLDNAVEEVLRRATPVYHMVRTAKNDIQICDTTVSAGEKVVMLYVAANHDPDKFENPMEMDISRQNARQHLAFGTGIHRCIGARLAQMEMQVLLKQLVPKFPNIRTTADPAYLRSNFVCSIKRLPVALH